jgi:hypothetical protein
MRTRQPVIIPDVKADEGYRPFVAAAEQAGYRAVQTTPLFTTADRLIGMVSTHFANVHTPTKIELETLIAYSRIAGDHLYKLLGNNDLAAKARSMQRVLYDEWTASPTTIVAVSEPAS